MSKKQFFWNIGSVVLILALVILLVEIKSNQDDIKIDRDKWKSIAESEQEIPTINSKAESFLNALNKAEHQEYLSNRASKKLEKELEEHYEDNHSHGDNGDQLIDIIHITSEKKDLNEASTSILYKLSYKSPFDSSETGVIDQRILTLMLDVSWIKEGNEYKVDKYSLELLEDNLDDYLSSLSKKDDNNE
ncbi:hypothetical protein MKX83_24025 [Cytobacillus sp. FSL M8-0252]|uniref:hypothetical protein n=1 Tax=Cytobacillus sp. FSL M8-0252 TaxID=2921621 RepID=UPI0030F684FC